MPRGTLASGIFKIPPAKFVPKKDPAWAERRIARPGYLTHAEVRQPDGNGYGQSVRSPDATLILLAYRLGLRGPRRQ